MKTTSEDAAERRKRLDREYQLRVRRQPQGKLCACRNEAHSWTRGGWVCKRCLDWETHYYRRAEQVNQRKVYIEAYRVLL